MKTYFWHIFVALTQLLNTVLGGWPDETTSSRMWRLDLQGSASAGWARRAIDRLFFWQDSHCLRAYEAERKRYQHAPIFR